MSKRTRRLLFYSFVFLFIIAGLAVVFYCDGWRVNIENCSIFSAKGGSASGGQFFNCSIKIERTGAVFIQTNPKGVIIKIGKEIFGDKSGLIQNGTLVSELLPGNYKVEIEKNNYLAWVKNIAIESGLVTEISKIVLIPQNLEKNLVPLAKSPDSFWINSDGKIIFKNNANLYYESQNSSPVKLRGDKLIVWSDDNSKIITQDSKNQTYYLYQIDDMSRALNITAVLNNLQKIAISDIKFHPLDSNRLIIQAKNNFLYILDINRLTLENIVKTPILAWTIENPSIYYIKKTQLVSFNLISKTENFSFDLPAQLINQNFLAISASANKIAFLTDSGGLYLFNQQSQDFKQIAHSAENFAISPDSKKIAFRDKDGKLNIYFTEDYQKGIEKKAGDVISFNFYLKTNGTIIKNISWYKDSSHVFIETPTAVDFVEIDDRLPINKYTLIENASGFNYQLNSNRLYFIQKNGVYFAEL